MRKHDHKIPKDIKTFVFNLLQVYSLHVELLSGPVFRRCELCQQRISKIYHRHLSTTDYDV